MRASALPIKVAPVFKVMAWSAKMVPWTTEVVPSVAELPTCQKMLDAFAPPAKMIGDRCLR